MNIRELQLSLSRGEMFFIKSEENRLYLTEFQSSDGYLCICQDKAVFFVDGRYIENAEKKVKGCRTELLEGFGDIERFVNENKITRITVERERLTLSSYENLKKRFPGAEICFDGSADEKIRELRCVKSEGETKSIIKAQRIAEKAFDEILNFIKAGVSEIEIAAALDYSMRRNGGEGTAFDTIALSGKNGSVPHGVPTDKKVEKGDFVTMDFGCICNGYRSDMTRTVAVGFVTSRQEEIYDTVLKAQNEAISKIKAGIKCRDADKIARDIIGEKGYGKYFTHSLGHGVGVEIHEYPLLSSKSTETLKAGNVVTVEPGIYIPGEAGVRIEDFGLVTEDGFLNFTKAPKGLTVL